MRTILLSAIIALLGLQSIRLFVTGLVWVVGESSDRIVLGGLALVAFASAVLAWPMIRYLGWRRTVQASAILLAVARLADQANPSAGADVYLGLAGTAAFGWLTVSYLGVRGRASGLGLAIALALDVAMRAGLFTIDVPLSASPYSMVFTAVAAVALMALMRNGSDFAGPPPLATKYPWTVFGIPIGLLFFKLVSGNFGQVSATGVLGWSTTAAMVTAGVVLGLLWSAMPTGRRWTAGSLPVALAALMIGLVLFRAAGVGWAAVMVGAAVARLIAWMPVGPGPILAGESRSQARNPALAVASGFIVFFVLLFAFYSFYSPEWVLAAAAVLVGIAGAFGALRVAPVAIGDRRTTAVVAAVAVFAALPGAINALSGDPDPVFRPPAGDGSVRILSYNIRQGFGLTNRWDLEAVALEIERHRPEIVALQEVGRGWIISGMADQLLWLSHRLGMRAYFGSNVGDLWGNALLTNFTTRSENHRFDEPGRVPRGVLEAQVLFGGSGLRILVTHLDHEDDGAEVRLRQIERVLEIWGGDPSTLVLGDFNSAPDSEEYARVVGAGLRDLHLEFGNPAPTRPADHPATRIDYVFASPGIDLIDADTPDSLASDHLPVLVTLRVP